jgi:glucose-6-phosphate 1-dehydrogenase
MKTKLTEFLGFSTYVSGQYDKDESFIELEKHLQSIEAKYPSGPKHRIFYMALPPSVFTSVAKGLRKNNYSKDGVNRIIVEKPFGKDLDSSRALMGDLKSLWAEHEAS